MTTHANDELTMALLTLQASFEAALTESFRQAEAHMALADVEDCPDDEIDDAYQERFHCEVCIVRNVLEFVWPVVNAYIRALEVALGIATPDELKKAFSDTIGIDIDDLPPRLFEAVTAPRPPEAPQKRRNAFKKLFPRRRKPEIGL
jgi:hypothetical protein